MLTLRGESGEGTAGRNACGDELGGIEGKEANASIFGVI
jgi:hypothetical protein